MMFDRARRWFDDFVDTIRAGDYSPLLPHKQRQSKSLPRKPWVITALGAAGLAGSLATDAIVTLAVGASVIGIAAGAGFAVAAAAGIFGAIYLHSRKHAKDVLIETNMAGQRVEGTRRDLYTLHAAQRKIIGLTEAFDEIAPPSIIAADVQDVIESTAAARARVKVLDAGESPEHNKTEYEFVRPVVQFADAAALIPKRRGPFAPAPAPKLVPQVSN